MTPAKPGADFGDVGAPSVSCLLYLFADQAVAHSTLLSHLDAQHGVPIPCGRPSVQLGPLERLVFAWIFWHLRDRGFVDLDYLEEVDNGEGEDADKRGGPPPDLVVRRVADVRGACGLDAEVLRACANQAEPIGVVLRRWAGEHIPLPLYAVVRVLQVEAASYELAELRDRDGQFDPFSDHRLGRFASEDCERIATLEPRFAELLSGWRTLEAQRSQAATDLVEQCRLALFDLRPPPILATGGPTPH